MYNVLALKLIYLHVILYFWTSSTSAVSNIMNNNELYDIGNGRSVLIEYEDDIVPFRNVIDWRKVFDNFALSDDFLIENMAYVPWRLALTKQIVSMDVINALIVFIDVPQDGAVGEDEMINLFSRKLEIWKLISEYQPLSEEFIELHFYELDMQRIVETRVLSDEFIWEHIGSLLHLDVLRYQTISEDMARRIIGNVADVYVRQLFQFQVFHEEFINSLPKENVDWEAVSKFQHFTFDFIMRNGEYLEAFMDSNSVAEAFRNHLGAETLAIASDVQRLIERMM